MAIEQISDSRLRLTEQHAGDERVLLALDTGVPAGGFPAQRISALARSGAVIISGNSVQPWRVSKLLPFNGTLFLCGTWVSGITIAEFLTQQNAGTVDTITTIARGCAHAVESDAYALCNTTTSLITSDGGCLLLDRTLSTEINRYLPLERRQLTVFPYRFSRLNDQANTAYQCGTLAWHLLTGSPLCTGSTAEEADNCHSEMSENPALHRLNPYLHPAVRDLVEHLIRKPDEAARDETLSRLTTLLPTVPVIEDIDETEADVRRRRADEAYQRSSHGWRRRRFLRRRGSAIALSIIAVLIIGTVPFQMIRSRLSPPSTAGLSPEDLVETFYDAWGTLNHTVMDDALADDVGRGLLREVTNLYVIDRVQLAHSMEERVVPAETWISRGRPAEFAPYGPVVDAIVFIRRTEEEADVTVDYTMWRPQPVQTSQNDGEGTGDAPLEVTRQVVRDRLTLTPTKWGWEISDIITTVIEGPSIVPRSVTNP